MKCFYMKMLLQRVFYFKNVIHPEEKLFNLIPCQFDLFCNVFNVHPVELRITFKVHYERLQMKTIYSNVKHQLHIHLYIFLFF